MLLLEDKLFCRNRRIGCAYLNESVKSLISICGLMRSYNILYTASRIGMLTCMWRLISFIHLVPKYPSAIKDVRLQHHVVWQAL